MVDDSDSSDDDVPVCVADHVLARRNGDDRPPAEDAAAQAAEWGAGMSPSEDDSDGGDDLAAGPRDAGAPVAELLQRRVEKLALLRDLYKGQFARLGRILRTRHAAYLVERTRVSVELATARGLRMPASLIGKRKVRRLCVHV